MRDFWQTIPANGYFFLLDFGILYLESCVIVLRRQQKKGAKKMEKQNLTQYEVVFVVQGYLKAEDGDIGELTCNGLIEKDGVFHRWTGKPVARFSIGSSSFGWKICLCEAYGRSTLVVRRI